MEMNEPGKFDPSKNADVKIELVLFPTAATAFDQFPDGRVIVGGYDNQTILFYNVHVASNAANRRRSSELQDQAIRVMRHVLNREGYLKPDSPTPVLGLKTLTALVNYKLWGRYTNNLTNIKFRQPLLDGRIRPAEGTRGVSMSLKLGELISFNTHAPNRIAAAIQSGDVQGTIQWKRDGVNFETVDFTVRPHELQRWNLVPLLDKEQVEKDPEKAEAEYAEMKDNWNNNLRAGMRDAVIVDLLRKAVYEAYPFLRGAEMIGEITLK